VLWSPVAPETAILGPQHLPILAGDRRLDFHLKKKQSRVFLSQARNRVWVAGRRSGKSTEGLAEIVTSAARFPWSMNWYMAPTFDQAEEIAWDVLQETLEMTGMILRVQKSKLTIELRNRSLIQLKSGEAFERLRGRGLGRPLKFIQIDECRQIAKEAWQQVVRPILADAKTMTMYGDPGRALFTGTPGGFDWFKELYDMAHITQGWEAFHSTALEGGNITPEEIDQLRQDLSERDFRQEMEASFEALTGRCYYAFEHRLYPQGNIDPDVKDNGGPLLIGMDFNVAPMTATISVKHPDPTTGRIECHTFAEMFIMNSNTTEMMQTLRAKFPNRKMVVFPDPHSAPNRSTSAATISTTDVSIIKSFGAVVYMPGSKGYPVKDRYNTTNGMLCNANKVRRNRIHPRCTNLIRTFDGLCYKEGANGTTNEPDKTSGLDHIGDAHGYMIMGAFPPGAYASSITELNL
jgi:hypothetical protein